MCSEVDSVLSNACRAGTTMTPRVTALINTYNHERFIEQCVRSVAQQDFPAGEMEIIVVDDGSTDRTPEITRKFEPRVRLIHKENGGQVSAFNVGVAEAQGEIIAFLDGDDWWAPNKLSEVLRAFDEHPAVAAVGHAYYEVYESATPQEIVAPEKSCLVDLSTPETACLANAVNTFLVTSRLSVRQRVLKQIGPLPVEAIFFDTLVFTLSFALGGAFILEKPLCHYRHHSQNFHNPIAVDEQTRRRQIAALGFRVQYLPTRLLELGVEPDLVKALMETYRVDYERTLLRLGERSGRWNVFSTELQRFRVCYKRPTLGYKLFQCAVAATALALPPRWFYRLFDWYSRNDIKRFRGILGRAEQRVPADFCRHTPVVPDYADEQGKSA